MPTYEPQSFETRHGECTIEQGTIRFHEGIPRAIRRTISGVREMDFDALKKPTAVLVTLYGALWTFQDLIIDVFDGGIWGVSHSAF